ncbi:MAG: Txe/YoeB family addiction module toxin [Fibromonadaceae bacterium]|jgi:Txe/YoeB family toxin of toxin-antitoxin system|nr:Txe/YoeB family addiction module toxin [Fibromonadaceae bacterium]
MFQIKYSKKAVQDIPKLKSAKLDIKAKELVDLISRNPYQMPPPYEKLVGELLGKLSRRINIKHRLVYQVFEAEKNIKIISLWSHYEF